MNIAAKQCCKKDCPTWENMTQSAARGNKPSFPIFQLDLGGFSRTREAAATRKPKEARDPRERRFLPKMRRFATEPKGFPVSGPPGKPDFPCPRPPASPSASLGWNSRLGSPRPLFGGAREPSPGRQRRAPRACTAGTHGRTSVQPSARPAPSPQAGNAAPEVRGAPRGLPGGPDLPPPQTGGPGPADNPRGLRGQPARGLPGSRSRGRGKPGPGPPAPSGSTHRAVVAAGPAPTFYSGPPPPWRHFPYQCPCQAPCSRRFARGQPAHRGLQAGPAGGWTTHLCLHSGSLPFLLPPVACGVLHFVSEIGGQIVVFPK